MRQSFKASSISVERGSLEVGGWSGKKKSNNQSKETEYGAENFDDKNLDKPATAVSSCNVT